MTDSPRIRARPRRAVVIVGIVTALVVFATATELAARVAWRFEGAITQNLGIAGLDEWEVMADDGRDLWYLVPNLTITLRDVLEGKRLGGREYSVTELEERLRTESQEAIYLRTNAHGYRGPELDPDPTKVRILMTGDSVTFGIIAPEDVPYPRVAEAELVTDGYPVEVVNAGVEGYAPKQINWRAAEFAALEPEIVTVLIGWHGILIPDARGRGFLGWAEDHSDAVRAFRRVPNLIARVLGRDENPNAFVSEQRVPDLDDPILDELRRDYEPPHIDEVRVFVQSMQAARAEVVLFTLPGLYVMDQEPTPEGLAFGFVTPWSNNPYVLAQLTEIYNEELRALALETGAHLVDLDAWSRGALNPRHEFFFDSVHLTDRGLRLMGEEIARQLVPIIEQLSD